MANLNNSFVYKKFKLFLISKIGKKETTKIWIEANYELKKLIHQHKKITKDEKIMILPLVALYNTLNKNNIKNSTLLLKEYAKEIGNRFSRLIYKITSIPGISKILWKNMPSLMKKCSSPSKGYERRIISENKELVGVDILKCPLHELTKKLGVYELASVVCIIDQEQMKGFKYIKYTRTKALGNGDNYCDYRLQYNKKSKI